jgi:hypothetical protein
LPLGGDAGKEGRPQQPKATVLCQGGLLESSRAWSGGMEGKLLFSHVQAWPCQDLAFYLVDSIGVVVPEKAGQVLTRCACPWCPCALCKILLMLFVSLYWTSLDKAGHD